MQKSTSAIYRMSTGQHMVYTSYKKIHSKENFMITAEILAPSLANFHCQHADRHMKLQFMQRINERQRAARQFFFRKKQIDVSF